MTSAVGYSEDILIERPTQALFCNFGWHTANCYYETFGAHGTLGRETVAEVVLVQRLTQALKNLNEGLPAEAISLAIEELTRDRSKMSLAAANREITGLMKDGVKVTFKAADGEEVTETVRVIDWNNPANNDFFLATQFWVTGEMYKRRLDMVGFVNGLPFIVIELKASHKALKNAYDQNLRDYKSTIPQLFWYNGIIILSNGSESKIGSVTAEWEHFADWKRINSEGEQGIVSLETMIRGTCDPTKLLDLVENFTLFSEEKAGLIKLLAKNHQVLGVNNTIEALKQIKSRQGKLGVFWHTQGSGKSVAMIFFAQKVLRRITGHWTFLIVTDRQELDGQIYDNFVNTGVVTEAQAQAQDSQDLKRMLQEDHRYIFTLIQKFRTEKGQEYSKLSDRSDIIVITDEAHRTQYDTFALNMRSAIPNAAFIAFTGTPLMVGEEKTREVFGDYVSIYNFQQSVEDRATVPLYYENRIPELQLTNKDFREEMTRLLEEAELDENQEAKVAREFSREYHLITRNDRLERIARDIVSHFVSRGYQGKAMVVSIDKATAVKMYDKVQRHWKAHLSDLKSKLKSADYGTRSELERTIELMQTTDMAVVVSQSQNEIEEMKKKGVDIVPHRRRMIKEDLDDKFKDPKDPFRIVFVCAMWMTGFDVPCCSTIYLDKPMRNHTLMQTIARANRVFHDKTNGLIVDYVGVFRDLEKALAIYAPSTGGGEAPVRNKTELVELLKTAVNEAIMFCTQLGLDLDKLIKADGFERVRYLDDAVDAILINDDTKGRYTTHVQMVTKLFRAIKPDPAANDYMPVCVSLAVILAKIRSLAPQADISEIKADIEELLDRSVFAQDYLKKPSQPFDLSKINFEALRKDFEQRKKRVEVERLRASISDRLQKMVQLNRSRLDLLERFQKMIDDYNAGSMNVEEFFKQLLEFTRKLQEEEKRSISENLSEEELAVFDILLKPKVKLKNKDEQQVKNVARAMLQTLKEEKLVLDWRKKQQSRAAVRLCIEQMLDQLPTPPFTPNLCQEISDATYQHVYEAYFGEGNSIYEHVGIGVPPNAG
jgi:type I restriction enzyme R subunit